MNAIENTDQFILSIPLEAHHMAQRFRQRHADGAKGKQVYLNTLAVYAVYQYLKLLGIAADLEASPSWDTMTQVLLDTGALQVECGGQIECRPVLPRAQNCQFPPEVWSDRVGYVAVQLDDHLEQATLLGFLAQVSTEVVPLRDFKPLVEIFDSLEMAVPEKGALEGDPSRIAPVPQLSQWLRETTQAGWELVESLLSQPQPAFHFRNNSTIDPTLELLAPGEVIQGKLLDSQSLGAADTLALLIGIAPKNDTSFNIRVKVIPLGESERLPSALDVSVRDSDGNGVMQAQARETKTLELKFGGEIGDRFEVCLTLGDRQLREQFII